MDSDEIAKTQEERKKMEQQLASLTSVTFDTDLYGGNNPFDGYEKSIPINDEEENIEAADSEFRMKLPSYTALKSIRNEIPKGGEDNSMDGFAKPTRIIDREDDYRRRRLARIISPERHDAFAAGDKTPDVSVRTYADIMKEEALKREKEETLRLIAKKKKEEEENKSTEKEREPVAISQPT